MTQLTENVIENLMTEGLKEIIKARRKDEALTVGRLRAGNSGIIVVNEKSGKDTVYGDCHRLALLRLLGVEITADESTHKIFEEGELNEIAIVKRFMEAPSLKNYTLLQGTEVPTAWATATGVEVTGRPDIVIRDENGNNVWLFELKKKLTPGGFENVVENKKPDSKHLCQAAHYSWQLGFIPTTLMYSWPIMKCPIGKKDFISSKEAWYYLEVPQWKSATEFTIKPGDWYFHLTWVDGMLHYQCKGMSSSIPTLITVDRLKDFYEATSSMPAMKHLGPRPTSAHVGKGVKASYQPCQYCDLKEVCDNYEHDYDRWLDELKLESARRDWTNK